jgi:ABC-type phosphate transport system substrate-binding protein
MKTRLGRMLVLVAACVGVALAVTAPAAYAEKVACTKITGSGSSLQGNLQAIWTGEFNKGAKVAKVECENAGEGEVTYVSTSSGRGLNCWGATEGELNKGALEECGKPGTVDNMISSDVGVEGPVSNPSSQMAKMDKAGGNKTENNEIISMPVAQSAIAVVVSMPVNCLPSVTTAKPRVEVKPLEEEWRTSNATLPQIIKLQHNSGTWTVSGCQTKAPLLFARSKGSGTTAGFKRFLEKINPGPWESFTSTAAKAENTEWPNQQIKKVNEKSSQQAEKVYETPNSMAYVDISDARNNGFSPAGTGQMKLHKNKAGEEYYSFFVEVQNNPKENTYAEPEESSGEAACKEAKYNKPSGGVAPNVDWSRAEQSGALEATEGAGKYPICTLTFHIIWHIFEIESLLGGSVTLIRHTVLAYLLWLVSAGEELAKVKSEHFAPVSKELRLEDEKALEGLTR